jgi:hypothetical protein
LVDGRFFEVYRRPAGREKVVSLGAPKVDILNLLRIGPDRGHGVAYVQNKIAGLGH